MPILKAGDVAPNFTAIAHTGETVELDKLRGKQVLLWFYPKADTPGCTIEGCTLRDKTPQISAKNTIILGVSFDSVADNKAFADKFQFPYPLLCDETRSLGLAYGAAETATDGYAKRIAYAIAPDGKITRVWEKVDVKTFADEALATLG